MAVGELSREARALEIVFRACLAFLAGRVSLHPYLVCSFNASHSRATRDGPFGYGPGGDAGDFHGSVSCCR